MICFQISIEEYLHVGFIDYSAVYVPIQLGFVNLIPRSCYLFSRKTAIPGESACGR